MAEWAQLVMGKSAPHGTLRRGRWYPVETRTVSGFVRLIGPGAVGYPFRQSALRIIDHDPDSVTRVQVGRFRPTGPSDSEAGLRYFGVCPRGHEIRAVDIRDKEADCGLCAQVYPIEDEEHA